MINYMAIPGLVDKVTTPDIVEVVCHYYQIDKAQILTRKTGSRALARIRQIIHYLCVMYHTGTTSTIGAEVGGLTHMTITYSTKAIHRELSYNKDLHTELQEINQLIKR